MRRRSRTRRALKWVGLVGCVVVAALAGNSMFYSLEYGYSNDESLRLSGIAIAGLAIHGHVAVFGDEEHYRPWKSPGKTRFRKLPSRIPNRHWLPSASRYTARHLTQQEVTIPLWIPFLILAIPTTFLWHRDRRPPKGHCRTCGYDLTGNESGVCSECGEAAA